MIDLFTFRAPFGILGRLAETLVLTRYMKGLLLTSANPPKVIGNVVYSQV